MVKINLCETCRKEVECFMKGIFKREDCKDCEPLSPEELLEKDEFANTIMVGPCPECQSENTINCENESPIQDITIGACLNCKTTGIQNVGMYLRRKGKFVPIGCF